MKRFLLGLFIGFFLICAAVIAGTGLYGYAADDKPAPELASLSEYVRPEDVPDNAAIALASLQRPEKMPLEDVYKRLKNLRGKHDAFIPEKDEPLVPEKTKIEFMGVAWIYTCWIVPYPVPGQCLQPYAFESKGIKNNKLLLDRYAEALKMPDFAADYFIGQDEDFFGIALLDMASSSYYFDKGLKSAALASWRDRHLALGRFIKEGRNTFMSLTSLLNLYSLSLQQAERFFVNGLSEDEAKIIRETLSGFSPETTDILGVLATETGFRRNELISFYRPLGWRLLSDEIVFLFKPYYINRDMNLSAPAVKDFAAYSKMSGPEIVRLLGKDEPETTDSQDKNIAARPRNAKTLTDAFSSFLDKNKSVYLQKFLIAAQQKSLLLSLKMKENGVTDAQSFKTVAEDVSVLNPLTGKQFVWDEEKGCLLYSLNESKYCSSVPNKTVINIR